MNENKPLPPIDFFAFAHARFELGGQTYDLSVPITDTVEAAREALLDKAQGIVNAQPDPQPAPEPAAESDVEP